MTPSIAAELGDRLGQIERGQRRRQRPHPDRGDERIGHVCSDLVERGGRRRGRLCASGSPPARRDAAPAGSSRTMRPSCIDHLQPAADVNGGGRNDPAVLDQRELGGAAADVDVEDALALVGGYARGAGAVGREHRLHVMAGGRGDEVAALLRQQAGDRLRRSRAAAPRRSGSPRRCRCPWDRAPRPRRPRR